MLKQVKTVLAGIAVAAVMVAPALAVTWHFVVPVVMSQGSTGNEFQTTVFGNFEYDSDTQEISNVFLRVRNSGLASNNNLGDFNADYNTVFQVDLFDGELTILATNESLLPATDPFVLELAFATPLLNDGPTEVDLVFASVGTCAGEVVEGEFCDNDTAGGFGVTGDGNNVTLVGTVSQIPVPAALPLMLAGLAGLGFFARRRKAA